MTDVNVNTREEEAAAIEKYAKSENADPKVVEELEAALKKTDAEQIADLESLTGQKLKEPAKPKTVESLFEEWKEKNTTSKVEELKERVNREAAAKKETGRG